MGIGSLFFIYAWSFYCKMQKKTNGFHGVTSQLPSIVFFVVGWLCIKFMGRIGPGVEVYYIWVCSKWRFYAQSLPLPMRLSSSWVASTELKCLLVGAHWQSAAHMGLSGGGGQLVCCI